MQDVGPECDGARPNSRPCSAHQRHAAGAALSQGDPVRFGMPQIVGEAGGALIDVRMWLRIREVGAVLLQLQDSSEGTDGGQGGLGAETPEIREPGKLRR